MRRVVFFALPFTLIVIPALLMCHAWLAHKQPPQAGPAHSQIVVRILITPGSSKPDAARPSSVLALPTPQANLPATGAAARVLMDLAATATPIETDMPTTEPMNVLLAVSTPVLASMPDADPITGSIVVARHRLLDLHNHARAEAGLPPYRLVLQLQQAAQLQADYLAGKPATELMSLGLMGHRGPHGETASARAAWAGYVGERVCENWAYFNTIQDAFDFWLTDVWHRPQVLSSDLAEVGFGISQHPEFGVVFVAVYGRQ